VQKQNTPVACASQSNKHIYILYHLHSTFFFISGLGLRSCCFVPFCCVKTSLNVYPAKQIISHVGLEVKKQSQYSTALHNSTRKTSINPDSYQMAHYYDEASIFSDGSSLDGSDDFGRKLLQHTKDAQRMHSLTQSHAFSKAKPLPRAALNLDNLERNNLNHPSSAAHDSNGFHPPSVSDSTASDPPLNPPQSWGRKGRPNHAWMRNIQSSPNIDWADAANDSLHSPVRVSTATTTRHAQNVSNHPAYEQQQHDSYISQWEQDQDFSAASLLESTPAVPSRSRWTIDQIREREAHATSTTLGQEWDKSTSKTLLSHVNSPSISAHASRSAISNKENIPTSARHSARSLYKTVETSAPATTTPRPAQRRADSMALLKRLSRTPSASPSPTSANNAVQSNTSRSEAAWSDKYPNPSTRPLFRGNSPQAPEPIKDSQPIRLEQENSSQAPKVVETPEPSPNTLITPSRPVERALPAKTPVVMGAWVDTPQTTRQQTNPATFVDNHALGSIAEDGDQRAISEPNLPASALDAVLKGLRNGKRREDDDPTLGDSTIASLEEVMAPSADVTMLLELPDVPAVQPPVSKPADQESTRTNTGVSNIERTKQPTGTAMNNRDERGQQQKSSASSDTGVKATPRQTRVDNALKKAIASAVSGSTSKSQNIRHTHTSQRNVQCDQCGRPPSVLGAAWNEYWGLYFHRDSRAPLGFRLTWLGLVCTTFWTWLLTEWILSSIFSHPKYATKMHGFGVNPHAPEFPYVLPTLLLRPLSPVLGPLASFSTWMWTVAVGQEKYKYYPASPGGWGSAAKVKIGPPGPRSAYYTRKYAAEEVEWTKERSTAQTWHSGGETPVVNTLSDDHAWTADGSMLDDEVL
jgi:hypothetical protein